MLSVIGKKVAVRLSSGVLQLAEDAIFMPGRLPLHTLVENPPNASRWTSEGAGIRLPRGSPHDRAPPDGLLSLNSPNSNFGPAQCNRALIRRSSGRRHICCSRSRDSARSVSPPEMD